MRVVSRRPACSIRTQFRITGRTVRSFQSSIDAQVDGLAVETFISWPEGNEGPSRIIHAEP